MWWSWALWGPEGAMAGPQVEGSVVEAVERCQRHPGWWGVSGERAGSDSMVGVHCQLGALPCWPSPRRAGEGSSRHWGHTRQAVSSGA